MEPLKKRDRFLSCDIFSDQTGNNPNPVNDNLTKAEEDAPTDLIENHPADATAEDNLIEAKEDAPAADLLMRNHPDATFDDRENASNVIEAEEESKTETLLIENCTSNHKDAPADLSMRQSGDAEQSKEVKVNEAGGGAVSGGKQINETKEPVAGDGKEQDVTKVTEHAGGSTDGQKPDETKVIGHGGGAPNAVCDLNKPDETMVTEHAGGNGRAPDPVVSINVGRSSSNQKVTEHAGGSDGQKPDETKLIGHGGGVGDLNKPDETMVIEHAGGNGRAPEPVASINAGGSNSNQQAAFQIVDGNANAVAPGGGTPPIDIQNEQTHTDCVKRKSQEPGEFSQDAPTPKRTKHGDAGRDEIGIGSSSITPPIAGTNSFILFGVDILSDQEEHELPVTRTLRLFGVDIDARNGSSPTDQESSGRGL